MAFVSLTDSHHRFHTLRSAVFVFFVVFTFRFSSINKDISLSSRSLLVSRDSFSLKPQNLVSIHCFLREKTSVSAIVFIVHLVSLMPDVTFVENLLNRSSGVQIPWDFCTRFGCYLYSTECS